MAGKALGIGAAALWAPVKAIQGSFNSAGQSSLKALGVDSLEEGSLKKYTTIAFKAAPYVVGLGLASIPAVALGGAAVAALSAGSLVTAAAAVGAGALGAAGFALLGNFAPGMLGGGVAAVQGAGKGVKSVYDKLEDRHPAVRWGATIVASPFTAIGGAVGSAFQFAKKTLLRKKAPPLVGSAWG